MKVNGARTEQMVKEHIGTRITFCRREIGSMMSSMASERKRGQMAPIISEITLKG